MMIISSFLIMQAALATSLSGTYTGKSHENERCQVKVTDDEAKGILRFEYTHPKLEKMEVLTVAVSDLYQKEVGGYYFKLTSSKEGHFMVNGDESSIVRFDILEIPWFASARWTTCDDLVRKKK